MEEVNRVTMFCGVLHNFIQCRTSHSVESELRSLLPGTQTSQQLTPHEMALAHSNDAATWRDALADAAWQQYHVIDNDLHEIAESVCIAQNLSTNET